MFAKLSLQKFQFQTGSIKSEQLENIVNSLDEEFQFQTGSIKRIN